MAGVLHMQTTSTAQPQRPFSTAWPTRASCFRRSRLCALGDVHLESASPESRLGRPSNVVVRRLSAMAFTFGTAHRKSQPQRGSCQSVRAYSRDTLSYEPDVSASGVTDVPGGIFLWSFLLFAGGAFAYLTKQEQARKAGRRVVDAQSRIDELGRQGASESDLEFQRAVLESAIEAFVVERKWRLGPMEIELLPNVREMASGPHHPSALRNRGPILDKLKQLLPADIEGLALEVASCSGAHVDVFAPAFPNMEWQPSDRYADNSPQLLQLDESGCKAHGNVLPAVALDASQPWRSWPVARNQAAYSLVFVSNLTHCAAWSVTQGLLVGASKALRPGGRLVIYGPFKLNGEYMGGPGGGNAKFDASLRTQNPEWGYRELSDVLEEAAKHGLALESKHEMPADNLLVCLRSGG